MNKEKEICKTQCCCNCKNQIELYKHPWNKVNKGSIMETTNTYACIVQFDCYKKYKGIIFEQKHGECELYVSKNLNLVNIQQI